MTNRTLPGLADIDRMTTDRRLAVQMTGMTHVIGGARCRAYADGDIFRGDTDCWIYQPV
ncbi:MAG: hypothetical protein M8353_08785 [ANME-2 cluster archaeon]|nr:hypothetical protein [ANME-2 cluster archaeon]